MTTQAAKRRFPQRPTLSAGKLAEALRRQGALDQAWAEARSLREATLVIRGV